MNHNLFPMIHQPTKEETEQEYLNQIIEQYPEIAQLVKEKVKLQCKEGPKKHFEGIPEKWHRIIEVYNPKTLRNK